MAYARWLTPELLLRSYIAFYEWVSHYRANFLIAPFHEVTSNFGRMIHRLNDFNDTRFEAFEHTPLNVNQCYAETEKKGGEMFISRPSEERRERKERLHSEYQAQHLNALREKAERIHHELTDG